MSNSINRNHHKATSIWVLFCFILFSCNHKTSETSSIEPPPKKLPSINIQNKNGIEWKTKKRCSLVYKDSLEIRLIGRIKYRGGISTKYEKRSYSLELEDPYKLGGITLDDDWIINASYVDKTFMRHKMSYDLFKEMASNNIAAKCSYIELSVDNNYQGLYILMEEVNASMLGIDKTDSEGMLFKGPPIFHDEGRKIIHDSLNYYQQKYPKINVSSKTDRINSFKNFLFNSSNEVFVEEISTWIDLENIMDWHILLLFSNNGDGLLKNFYLYKLNSQTPFRIAIWDYDHSFGRDGDNEYNMMDRPIECDRAILLDRLMSIKETNYSNKIKNRWFELRKKNIISVENIEKHIKANDANIQLGIEANFERWPVDSDWYFDDNGYDQEVEIIRQFVKHRIPQLDEYFNQLETTSIP